VAIVMLDVLFYVAFTLMLGCLFRGRGAVAGIGIGLILMGQFFKGMLPLALVQVAPWLLGDVASSFALDMDLEVNRTVPVVASVITTTLWMVVAIRRFAREEF
jgi:RsiW-degrading membrane proteinase PrsW (M82 family)